MISWPEQRHPMSLLTFDRRLLLAAFLSALLAACGSEPAERRTDDQGDSKPAAQGIWARWNAYGDEISYLNTQYVSEGPPIVAETLNIWRPEPAFTYVIKTRRAFWCPEEDVQLVERWVSKNGAPLEKRELPEEMLRRKSIREFDTHSGTLAAPPNQIESLHRTVCNRSFGDRVVDPMADFERLTAETRERAERRARKRRR